MPVDTFIDDEVVRRLAAGRDVGPREATKAERNAAIRTMAGRTPRPTNREIADALSVSMHTVSDVVNLRDRTIGAR